MSAPAAALQARPATAPAPEKSDRFPGGIPFIVGNEGAERFSFYGMKAILYLYLVALYTQFVQEAILPPEQLAAAKAQATQVVHLFNAGVYMFPLIGAIVSDRLFGKYNVIFFVSLLYCAGHAVLAVAGRLGAMGNFGGAQTAMYLGLSLIALGSGGIKPCVSANVGDQFTAENGHLVTKVFQIFYFIINFGSFFSTIVTPLLFDKVSAEVAFLVPGILMGIATFIFWLGRKRFVRVPPRPGGKLGLLDSVVTTLLFSPIFAAIIGYFFFWRHYQGPEGAFFSSHWWLFAAPLGAFGLGAALFGVRQRIEPDRKSFLPVLIWSFTHQGQRKSGEGFFEPARRELGAEAGDGPPAVLRVMLVFSMVSVFWALFDQHSSTWVEQAKHMDLVLPYPIWLGRWAILATIALSLFAGTWLFSWISNRPLRRRTSVLAVGAVLALGALAGVVDLLQREWDVYKMNPAQMSALNPLMVMLIIPGLNLLVYRPLAKRGITIKPLQKMTVGMFLAALAFVSAALLQKAVEAQGDGNLHAVWQAVPYFIITVAEVLVSVTGLEFAYTQAPRAMKSTMASFWLLCVTMGNLIVAFLAPLQKSFQLSSFFWVFAALMAGAALAFTVLAYFYKGKTYLQQAGSSS